MAASEITRVKLEYIALTNAASLLIAKKSLFEKYGMSGGEVVKQASWAATRDYLVLGGEQRIAAEYPASRCRIIFRKQGFDFNPLRLTGHDLPCRIFKNGADAGFFGCCPRA